MMSINELAHVLNLRTYLCTSKPKRAILDVHCGGFMTDDLATWRGFYHGSCNCHVQLKDVISMRDMAAQDEWVLLASSSVPTCASNAAQRSKSEPGRTGDSTVCKSSPLPRAGGPVRIEASAKYSN